MALNYAHMLLSMDTFNTKSLTQIQNGQEGNVCCTHMEWHDAIDFFHLSVLAKLQTLSSFTHLFTTPEKMYSFLFSILGTVWDAAWHLRLLVIE